MVNSVYHQQKCGYDLFLWMRRHQIEEGRKKTIVSRKFSHWILNVICSYRLQPTNQELELNRPNIGGCPPQVDHLYLLCRVEVVVEFDCLKSHANQNSPCRHRNNQAESIEFVHLGLEIAVWFLAIHWNDKFHLEERMQLVHFKRIIKSKYLQFCECFWRKDWRDWGGCWFAIVARLQNKWQHTQLGRFVEQYHTW